MLLLLTFCSGCFAVEELLFPDGFQVYQKQGKTGAMTSRSNSASRTLGVAELNASDPGLLVGGPGGAANEPGKVYRYSKAWNGWNLVQTLTASDASNRDRFGDAIAIAANDELVIGAPGANGLAGKAYVFGVSGNTYQQQQILQPGDLVADDEFGTGAAISSEHLVVGTFGNNDGAMYAYRKVSGTWTQTQKITAPDSDSFLGTGDGNLLIHGNLLFSIGANFFGGAVFVYEWDGAQWTLQNTLDFPGYGDALAFDGQTLFVGAHQDRNENFFEVGSVHVFEKNGNDWDYVTKIVAGDQGDRDDHFGRSLSLDGNRLLVGAVNAPGKQPRSGAAYLFQKQGNGSWQQIRKLTESNGETNDAFGTMCHLDGEWALVGAPQATVNNTTFAGKAVIFNLDARANMAE